MKIKHWSGYGNVNVTVIKRGNYYKMFLIVGNHECGLTRPFHDEHCIRHWLKRFIPKGMEMRDYMDNEHGYEIIDGVKTECLRMTMFFKETKQ